MKFGKQLKEQSVKAWDEYYMSYKRLKRVIKKLVVQLKEREEQMQHNAQRNAVDTSNESTALLMTGDGRKEFNAVLDNDIDKVNTFFLEKLEELRHAYDQLIEGGNAPGYDADVDGVEAVNIPADQHHVHIDLHSGRSQTDGHKHFNYQQTNNDDNDDKPEQSPQQHAATEPVSHTNGSNSHTNADSITSNNSHPSASGSLRQRSISRSVSTRRGGHNTIGQLSSIQLDEKCHKALDFYRFCLQLKSYSDLNFMGFGKILKKYDKNTDSDTRDKTLAQLDRLPFRHALQQEVMQYMTAAEDLYTKYSIANQKDMIAIQTTLANTRKDVENPQNDEEEGQHMKAGWIVIAIACGIIFSMLPVLPHHKVAAHRCLGLLAYVTVMWVTEAVPFFVTSVTIPFIVAVSGILSDDKGQALDASHASKLAFSAMFTDTIMLILGGFAISSAFSKCQFELRLAALIQRRVGDRPKLFLLAFMLLGGFLSMWISNVAAPVLLTALILPIIRDFGRGNSYAKALLLGLSISCNIGGMMSPIASPQNAIALGALEDADPDHQITFGQWIMVSLPFCLTAIVLSWLYITTAILRDAEDVPDQIPTIIYEKSKFTTTHMTVILTTLTTIVLWCSLSYTRPILGEMGTVAVIPFCVFFGTGILTKNDLLNFQWNLVLLVGGGSVLGKAVDSSKLLHIISNAIAPELAGHTPYVQTLSILLMVFVITTFVSHTVAALILSGLIVTIGQESGHVQTMLQLATLMMSGTMSLPMSSFPNINSLLTDDDFNRPFLRPIDFLKHGTPISTMLLGLSATLGYVLCKVVYE